MGINLISSIIVFIVQMGINFFLTPFILKSLGNEAFGFLNLANSIVSYGYILSVAINSVAGRFVALEYHKLNSIRANYYFSTVVIVNIFFTILVAILSVIFTLNLEFFLNISQNLTSDVKLMFLVYFLNFCLGLFNTIFTITAFVKNKIYIISIRNAISSIIFGLGIILFFYFFLPKLYYVAICALISSFFVFFSTVSISKKIAPDIKFNISNFSFKMVKKLLNSGIWNSFNALNRVLLTGLDLLICNLFISPVAMGILSVSKTGPLIIESFVATICSTFFPKLVEIYSKKNITALISETKFYIKVVAFIITTPCVIFVILGIDFFTLWLNFKEKSEILEIYQLCMISLVPIIFISYVFVLFNIDSVTNKLKRSAMANLVLGISTILSQILILKYTEFGLFGIVIVAAVLYSLRILIFDIINASLNLSLNIFTFYKPIFINIAIFAIFLIIFYFFKKFIFINSWLDFIKFTTIFLLFGYTLNFIILFNKSEKSIILNKIFMKFKRTKN